MSYTAPTGNAIAFDFTDSGYSAPTGNDINFEFAYTGVDCSDIGVTTGITAQLPTEIIVGAIGVDILADAQPTYITQPCVIGVDTSIDAGVLYLVGIADASCMSVSTGITSSILDTVLMGSVGVDIGIDSSLLYLIQFGSLYVETVLSLDILEFNADLAQIFYLFTLTGEADGLDDVEIPMSSFQGRLRSGKSSYLSVVIPDATTNSSAVTARANGDLRVDMAYKINNEFVQRQQLALVHLSDIRLDIGTKNQSITLSGYRQETYTNKSVLLKNPVYKSIKNGEFLVRFGEANFDLNPGDTVTVGNDSFIANLITYMVSASTGSITTQMEVSQ